VGDMSRLAAVAGNLYSSRMVSDEEFNWLLADIEEYNVKSEKKSVSLLETTARAEMAEDEAKKTLRKEQQGDSDPLVASDDVLVEAELDEFSESLAEQIEADEEEEEEDRPDLLLREAARIVSDVAELEANIELLDIKFSQLNAQKAEALN
jgi:hypothetical protein